MLGFDYNKIKPQQLIWVGFFTSILIFIFCIISRPESLGHNDGLSYFGAVWWTVIPYSIAFAQYALCCWLASSKVHMTEPSGTVVKWFLRLMAILLIGLVLTPHTIISALHRAFGSTLFATQLLIVLYLFYINKKELYIFALLIVMIISGLFSAFFLFSIVGFMIQAQIAYQVAFVIILTHYLAGIVKEE